MLPNKQDLPQVPKGIYSKPLPFRHSLCERKPLAPWIHFKKMGSQNAVGVYSSFVGMISDSRFRAFPEVLILASSRQHRLMLMGFTWKETWHQCPNSHPGHPPWGIADLQRGVITPYERAAGAFPGSASQLWIGGFSVT